MQEVEYRVFASALFITCRGIDHHPAVHLKRGAVIPYGAYSSVGHVFYLIVFSSFSGNDENVVKVRDVPPDEHVQRVQDLLVVNNVGIGVDLRLDRGGSREFPQSVAVVFHKRRPFLFAEEIAVHLNRVSSRGVVAEGDGLVRIYHRHRVCLVTVPSLLGCHTQRYEYGRCNTQEFSYAITSFHNSHSFLSGPLKGF